jgi:voltage-gated potassium channel
VKNFKSSKALDRYTKASDGPLVILALAMIPLLLIPLLMDLSTGWEAALLATDYLIWALFTVDYLVRLYLSPGRMRFVRTHVPDLVIVVVPFLRPLRVLRSGRILRLLRLSRGAAFAAKGLREVRAILRSRGLNYVLLSVVILVFVAAFGILELERDIPGANLTTYGDALWWATATVTTVGYGDLFPVSIPGRAIAVVLMVAGITLFGVLTATIAAYFVEHDAEKGEDTLKEISKRLEAIEQGLETLESPIRERRP